MSACPVPFRWHPHDEYPNEAFHRCSSVWSADNTRDTSRYLDLKLQEMNLCYEYTLKKQEEKEEQKEAQKLQRELEEARKSSQKEKTHYQNALL